MPCKFHLRQLREVYDGFLLDLLHWREGASRQEIMHFSCGLLVMQERLVFVELRRVRCFLGKVTDLDAVLSLRNEAQINELKHSTVHR